MTEEPLILECFGKLDAFCSRLDERVEKQRAQLEACKKKNELDSKLAQELQLKCSLQQRRGEVAARLEGATRALQAAAARGELAPSDRARLDRAREMYQIAKELTGIRFDYSAPPDVAKGYVKSEARKLLEPFELREGAGAGDVGAEGAGTVEEQLWERVRGGAALAWP